MTSPSVLIATYYTIPGPYAREHEGLRESCYAHGYPLRAFTWPDQGSWLKNTAIKPAMIRRMREQLRGPFLFLDADAEVVAPLEELFSSHAGRDLAVCRRHGVEVLGGSIYVGDTSTALALLRRWEALQAQRPDVLDQRNLQDVLHQLGRTERIGALAYRYCKIFDAKDMDCGPSGPAVLHKQASRRFR